jgi:hypothetical protein
MIERPSAKRVCTSLDEARLQQQAIGVQLRQMFAEVVQEPVPRELLLLLHRADERHFGGEMNVDPS